MVRACCRNGTGKTVRVAVFAPRARRPKRPWPPAPMPSAWTTWPRRCKAGDLNFDVVIATPDAMRVVGKLGQVLGPRGLMPNPKVGTVTAERRRQRSRTPRRGQVQFRTDKAGASSTATIGKAGFEADLAEGQPAAALLLDLIKAKLVEPARVTYCREDLAVSSTMGPGVIGRSVFV